MGTLIQVGKEFTLFKEKHQALVDGSYFEALDEKDGFIMTTYLANMVNKEKTYMREEQINVRMIKEGNKILFITRYGLSPLMFEVSFDPTLYGDERAMQIAFDNHMVTFISVERSNNEIQTLRTANFPMKLKQALITAWSSAFNEENYSRNYAEWVNGLYRYDMWTLWEMAEDVGFFGERGIFE